MAEPLFSKRRTVLFNDLGRIHRPIQNQILNRTSKVIRSENFILGREIEEFEHKWAEYCEANSAIGVGNGLDALRLILMALGVGSGDEVIVPDNTFIATWIAVSLVGAKPIPVEHDPLTFNIEPTRVRAAITNRTKAIVAVHLYGHPAELSELQEIADSRDIYLVEDAAQAHGATYKGKKIGSHSVAVAWSFYPGKNLGAMGDAGGITTQNTGLAKELKKLRNYGSADKYIHEVIGLNSRMDELQAAVLNVKLPHLDKWNSRRRDNAETYLNELSGFLDVKSKSSVSLESLPSALTWTNPVWHQFVIRVTDRDLLKQELADRGIETMIHYPIGPKFQLAYGDSCKNPQGEERQGNPGNNILSLPIGPHLNHSDIRLICEAIRKVADW